MNVYDSARMVEILAPLGYEPVEAPEAADMVILNTCHIREKAAEKVYSELGRLGRLKAARERGGNRMILAVSGCVAQAEGAEILARAPHVDMVFGPQTYHRLVAMVDRLERTEQTVLDTEFPAEPKFDSLPATGGVEDYSAFLTVQEGCDKFCTFCVVPYTRGAEYSRPVDDILAEARRLVASGAREITLLGQNVNAYHGRTGDGTECGLGDLIGALSGIEGLDRIRYTTSHPADMDDALVRAHRDVPALMPFLHLPVQSGSDRVLRAMNRRHTADDYRRLADRLRRARPDIGLSSDFIVGFPGETDRDFRETLRLARDVAFIQAYSFNYSPRPGTPAAGLDNQVPDRVKAERLHELQSLLERQQSEFNRSCIGRVLPVLLTRRGRHPGQLVGRSPYMQPVHVYAGHDRLGAVALLRIEDASAHSLAGMLATGSATLERPGARDERAPL